jgi:hypothetical protein
MTDVTPVSENRTPTRIGAVDLDFIFLIRTLLGWFLFESRRTPRMSAADAVDSLKSALRVSGSVGHDGPGAKCDRRLTAASVRIIDAAIGEAAVLGPGFGMTHKWAPEPRIRTN